MTESSRYLDMTLHQALAAPFGDKEPSGIEERQLLQSAQQTHSNHHAVSCIDVGHAASQIFPKFQQGPSQLFTFLPRSGGTNSNLRAHVSQESASDA